MAATAATRTTQSAETSGKQPSHGSTAPTPVAPPKHRELPVKEAAAFKLALKAYESREYKKGLKTCEGILKKCPDHGETMAMRGLFCSQIPGKDAEALDWIRKGIRHDITSHICWHVFGLYHRGEKNYEDALKCYFNALKYDPENIQIIRDVALLQIQTRNYTGFLETRHFMLELKPNNKMYWLGLIVSHYLIKSYDVCIKLIDTYEAIQVHDTSIMSAAALATVRFETSELLYFRARVLEESGGDVISYMNKVEGKIVDIPTVWAFRARAQLKSGLNNQAREEYMRLLNDNPDSLEYLTGYVAAHGLRLPSNEETSTESISLEDRDKLDAIFVKLQSHFPRSSIISRLPLNWTQPERFSDAFAAYITPLLQKGVFSLFVSVSHLITIGHRDSIQACVSAMIDGLKSSSGSLPASPELKEPPTVLMHALYFLAQFYDFVNEYSKAVELIDAAIAHSPTVVELLMTKARILKHAGNIQGACDVMNHARKLDLQDRYVNSKCAKYMLRADRIAAALEIAALFTKADSKEPLADLQEMQCSWFMIELGAAYARLGNMGKALSRYHTVHSFYKEAYEDQFDFHTYSLRKGTLSSYVDLLRMEDVVRSHPLFRKAAFAAIEIYIHLFDAAKVENVDPSMTPAELKKLARKARKAELKGSSVLPAPAVSSAATSKATNNAAVVSKSNGASGVQAITDSLSSMSLAEDHFIQGVDFMHVAATTFVKELLATATAMGDDVAQRASWTLRAWIAGVEVYSRLGKWALASACLVRALEYPAPSQPDFGGELHLATMRMVSFFSKACVSADVADTNFASIIASVKEVLSSKLSSTDLATLHQSFCSQASIDATAKQSLVVAKSLYMLALQQSVSESQPLFDDMTVQLRRAFETLPFAELAKELKWVKTFVVSLHPQMVEIVQNRYPTFNVSSL